MEQHKKACCRLHFFNVCCGTLFVLLFIFTGSVQESGAVLFPRKRCQHSDYHQSEPYQNQVMPADIRNGIGKQTGGYGGGHIAHEIQKTGGSGNHAGISEAGAVAAPQHGSGR